ncbi:kinetochore protein Spc25 [Ambystoma mexicanum]|uniref:kinetochore protein Spc25 n=1 Tax=Ambystoma mexicanum TaxID=8296 RepID=UPI0037E76DD1
MSQKTVVSEQSLLACMEEFRSSFVNPSIEDATQLPLESYKESLGALTETWCKKYKEGEQMIKKTREFQNETLLLNKRIKEKQAALLETISKLQRDEAHRATLAKDITALKEDLAKKKEIILANKRANKDRLKELHKSATIFKERLGLEIRKVNGDRLQFVFRYINPKDLELPYTFLLHINEQGDYEVSHCDPPLECVSEFQQKVRETNNFPVLLANFRKAFAALPH